VDQAALDAAIILGIDHGGFCPLGRRSEWGPIPECYRLEETPWTNYLYRTRLNVLEADATLLLCDRPAITSGTLATRQVAKRERKPWMQVYLPRGEHVSSAGVASWLLEHEVGVLNVAGPRASRSPYISELALAFLLELLVAL